MPLHKNNSILVNIDSIASDGNGVARHEGQVVFVPGAAPGDTLRVRVVKAAKKHAYGRVEQVVTPGAGRIAEDCPISHSCGGCCFRHISYQAELQAKAGFVADALQRIGGIEQQPLPILPSPAAERYRNKVQYPVAADGSGRLVYGFYASRSHRVVPCANCLLQPQVLNDIAALAANTLAEAGALPYDETTRKGHVRHLYIREGAHTGEVLLCIVATSFALPGKQHFVQQLVAAFPQIKTIVLNKNAENTNVILGHQSQTLFGSGSIASALCGVPQQLDVQAFSQVNTLGAERLFEQVRLLANPDSSKTILDLYCGAGVIGLSMAHSCKALVGVEVVPQAVESANASAAAMGLSNTRFLCEDAAAAAQRLAAEGLRPDILVMDPPRKGADGATIAAVLQMAPPTLVMVSCNSATMARDAALLCAGGYSVAAIQPVDMFPRTRHVECVMLFKKG